MDTVAGSIAISVRPFYFFFNDSATNEIYTLSLHDALPIYLIRLRPACRAVGRHRPGRGPDEINRKSTRLNSSHGSTSYAVFCSKNKKQGPPALRPPLRLMPPNEQDEFTLRI